MDWRVLVLGLIVTVSGIYFFDILWGVGLHQNSILLLNISILMYSVFLELGLALAVYGFIRKGIVNDTHAGGLFLGSFALAILTLVSGTLMSIGYNDDLAACGGLPEGLGWSRNDTVLTRCDIFYRTPSYPATAWIGTLGLVTAAVLFLSALVAVRRNSIDQSTTASPPQS